MARRVFKDNNPPPIDEVICNAWQNHVHDGVDADGHMDKVDAFEHVDWGTGASLEDLPANDVNAADNERTIALKDRGFYAKALRTIALKAIDITTDTLEAATKVTTPILEATTKVTTPILEATTKVTTGLLEATSVTTTDVTASGTVTADKVVASNAIVAIFDLTEANNNDMWWELKWGNVPGGFSGGLHLDAPKSWASYAILSYTRLESAGLPVNSAAVPLEMPKIVRDETGDNYKWSINRGSFIFASSLELRVIFFK